MRTIKVSIARLRAAIERAEQVSDDWQAQCCEIALIPQIARRYAELNDRFPAVAVKRHEGKPHKGMTRDDNLAVPDWSVYAGYVLNYGIDNYRWNSVSTDHYGHSPSTCWSGMGRETVSQFIHDLRMLALGYSHTEILRSIERAKIQVY